METGCAIAHEAIISFKLVALRFTSLSLLHGRACCGFEYDFFSFAFLLDLEEMRKNERKTGTFRFQI